jgi:hypothetical protein
MLRTEAPPQIQTSRQWLPLLLAAAVFSALSILAAVKSDAFLEADSCVHYLYARFAIGEPHYLVNVWGRPLVTGLYALPAALVGRIGVRLTSLAVALATAGVAWKLAREQQFRWPALAFIFTLGQPLVFLHSFSELTELPFALLLGLAFLAYQNERWAVMAILAGLLPLARPEGLLFVLLAAAALLAQRRWWWMAILPLPLVAWDYAGWAVYGKPIYTDALASWLPHRLHWILWLWQEWPYAPKSAYASGHILHFLALLPAAVGPLIFPAMWVGMWGAIGDFRFAMRYGNAVSHRLRCRLLIAVIPLLILIAHSLLYWLGRMASNGELRYMLIVAPFWALLAAGGWGWIFQRLNWSSPIRWAGAAVLLPTLLHWYYPVLPLKWDADWDQAEHIARWYRQSAVSRDYPVLLVSHPAFYYFMDVSPTDAGRMRQWSRSAVVKAAPGAVLVWDPVYGMSNSDRARIVTLGEIRRAGWIEDWDAEATFNPADAKPFWRIFRSPRSVRGEGTLRQRYEWF